jgi:hypothetical protein
MLLSRVKECDELEVQTTATAVVVTCRVGPITDGKFVKYILRK